MLRSTVFMAVLKTIPTLLLTIACTCSAAQIEAIHVASAPGFYTTWGSPDTPGSNLFPEPLFPTAFVLADGTTVAAGAGSSFVGRLSVGAAVVDNNLVTYSLTPLMTTSINSAGAYTGFAYAMGVGSSAGPGQFSQGVFDFTSPLRLVAAVDSSQATITGSLRYVSPVMYPADLYIAQGGLDAAIGDLIPFTLTLTLANGAWGVDTFSAPFTYNTVGTIGTIPNQSAAPEPRSCLLLALGLSVTMFAVRRISIGNNRQASTAKIGLVVSYGRERFSDPKQLA
jgi:hypothetical protein